MRRASLVAVPVLFLALCSGTADSSRSAASDSAGQITRLKPWTMPPPPEGVLIEKDVVYLPPDRSEKADIYHPKKIAPGQRLPSVIMIHGGGFNDGDKGRPREFNIGTNLAVNGYLVMSINYKLTRGLNRATWPQPLHDAVTAVRWLRKNADSLRIDPDRIGVIGCSAGGNLAAFLALLRSGEDLVPSEPYGEFSPSVSCAIDFYGPLDLLSYHDMKMFGKTREEAPELYREASPVLYAHRDAAPMLIVHGTADRTVALSQSEMMAAALQRVGANYQLVIIPDAPHTFDLQPKQRDLRPLVLGFLDAHLKSNSETAEMHR